MDLALKLLRRVMTHGFLALTALRSRKNCLFFDGQITSSNRMLIWRPTMKKARLRVFENRPMKTYKMTTNAIKWKIADEREPDNTHQQVTSPSKGNKENYDCSMDKKITLLKNMAEALDVSKRYYEQLKQNTNHQKQDKDKVNIGSASLVQYLKSKLQADAEHD
jgi:hypothetical protein